VKAGYAAARSVVSQGVSIALGQQEHFDWRAVAAAAIVPVVTSKLSLPKLAGYEYAADFGNRMIGGAVQQMVQYGKIDWRSVATDSFGNTIGNAIVAEIRISNMPQHIKDLDENSMNREVDGKKLNYAHQAYAHIMRSGGSDDLAEQFAKDVSKVGYKYQEWMDAYKGYSPEEKQAMAMRQLDDKWENKNREYKYAFLTDGPGHTESQEIVMGGKWGPRDPMNNPQYFQRVVDFFQGTTETYIHSMKQGEIVSVGQELESSDSARSKINYVFRQAMSEAFSSGHAADPRTARMYETMALHIYQDATSEGHRNDITGPRPWPMGNDNNMVRHIISDAINLDDSSNNRLATKYVDLWFDRGYVPEGDILNRVGVDTNSSTRATEDRWNDFHRMELQLENRPLYQQYVPPPKVIPAIYAGRTMAMEAG
jgi:hypothetical protein